MRKASEKKKSEIIWISLWPPSSPDLNPLNYDMWVFLENKKKPTFHSNIGSLKTGIVRERNKMSEDFILKAYKSFQRRVDAVTEKNGMPYWVNLRFCVNLRLKLIVSW